MEDRFDHLEIDGEKDATKATKDDSWDIAGKEMLSGSGENSKNCSVEFKDAKSIMDEYEKKFFSNENRADRLFPEIDPRFHQKKFEKENSWEPSVVEMERQPSPERSQSNLDESMRTSTPKKPDSVLFRRLIPLHLDISSVHQSSTNITGSPIFAKCSPSSSSIFPNGIVQNGQLFTNTSVSKTTVSEKPNLLKMNSRRLAYGAVGIGDQLGLKLEMENVSDRMLNVRSNLDSGTDAFEIVGNQLELIGPGQKSELRVIFKPDKDHLEPSVFEMERQPSPERRTSST